MNKRRSATAAGVTSVLIVVAAFVQGCPGQALGLERGSLVMDGRSRTYSYRVPADYDGTTPLPVVLVLHGFGGTGAIQARTSHFEALVDSEHFVAVFPDGADRRWRFGGVEARRGGVDDVAFLKEVVRRIGERVVVDPKRVYATGFSNGGFMSLTLACVAPDTFAAIAPVAGAVSPLQALTCDTARPVPTLLIHGTDDPLVPYAGGTIARGSGRELEILSAPAVAELVAGRNGCTGPPTETTLPDVDTDDGTRIVELRFECNADGEVLLYRVEGGGHTWPGGNGVLGERVVGRRSQDIDATALIWEFFKRHSLP